MLVKRVNYCDNLGLIYDYRSFRDIYWKQVKKFLKVSHPSLLDS